jgi:hypothetical protein
LLNLKEIELIEVMPKTISNEFNNNKELALEPGKY